MSTEKSLRDLLQWLITTTPDDANPTVPTAGCPLYQMIAEIETELNVAAGSIGPLAWFDIHDYENQQYPYGVLYSPNVTFQPYELKYELETPELGIYFRSAGADLPALNRLLWAYTDAVIRLVNNYPTLGDTSMLYKLTSVKPAITAMVNGNYEGVAQVKISQNKEPQI